MYDAPSKSKHVNKAELEYIEQDRMRPVQVRKQRRKTRKR